MEIQIMEKAEVCANCKRYYQHYVKAEGERVHGMLLWALHLSQAEGPEAGRQLRTL